MILLELNKQAKHITAQNSEKNDKLITFSWVYSPFLYFTFFLVFTVLPSHSCTNTAWRYLNSEQYKGNIQIEQHSFD